MQYSVEHQVLERNDAGLVCTHYWLIASPNGPTSQGVCKVCGEAREFKNSVQITSWESEGGDYRQHGLTVDRTL
ncbi:MAG: hypothetical protein HYY00_00970 [Chloroflexi bacterium]|nr:hypothetical protein [Chloroflexota bacterium]